MTQDAAQTGSEPAPTPFAQKATKVFLWTLGGLVVIGGGGLLVLATMPDQHQAFDPKWIRDLK